jgi:hypothetical protein
MIFTRLRTLGVELSDAELQVLARELCRQWLNRPVRARATSELAPPPPPPHLTPFPSRERSLGRLGLRFT